MKDEGLGFAGWLLADLVLVLAIIFLAIVPGDPEAKPFVAPTWSEISEEISRSDLWRDTHFSGGFAADGYPAPSFKVVDGSLPPGIHLDEAHGLLHGRPEREGSFEFVVRASNQAGAADLPFDLRVRPPLDECRPTASFRFSQIVVPYAQNASWQVLFAGRVRQELTKADELAQVSPQELANMPVAVDFLRQRQADGYQIALVETFGGNPGVPLASAVNNELAEALRVQFPDSPTGVAFLLDPDAPRQQWSADYLATTALAAGEARINIYFMKALPVECF